MQPRLIPISEIFGPTIQGEGVLIGQQTMFVRVGGCDYNCAWCDTMYAVDPRYKDTWEKLDSGAIFARTLNAGKDIGAKNVTISGGNPCLFDLHELILAFHQQSWRVHVETQGSLAPRWLMNCDSVTISPKGPSSGNVTPYDKLEACLRVAKNPSIKVVIGGKDDLEYATTIARDFGRIVPIIFQPCNRTPGATTANVVDEILNDCAFLAQYVIAEGLPNTRVLPQLHVLLWGNQRGK